MIQLVPQSTDLAGPAGSNAALLKALKERKALQEMLGGERREQRAPAFAPANNAQAAFGYAGVLANALGDHMVVQREKQAQLAGAKNAAAVLRGLGPPFDKLSEAQITGLAVSNPQAFQALMTKAAEHATRKPDVSFGVIGQDPYGTSQYGWVDKDKRTTTLQPLPAAPPADPAAAPAAAPGQAAKPLGPMPAGADPKKWRELSTERAFTEQASAPRKQTQGNIVIQDIDRALNLATDPKAWLPVAGAGGAALQWVPGTAAHDVSKLVSTVKANIGFDQLNAMRAASPTGAALGNVTEKETAFLQSVVGNLEQSQSPQQFQENLMRVRNVYANIIHGEPLTPGVGATGPVPVLGETPAAANSPPMADPLGIR